MRGTAPAQIPGAKISVCHGVGGMFAASGTIIKANEQPEAVVDITLGQLHPPVHLPATA